MFTIKDHFPNEGTCYIGGLSAAAYWGLIEKQQGLVSVVCKANTRALAKKLIGNSKTHIFTGDWFNFLVQSEISSFRCFLSNEQKTVIDLIEHPTLHENINQVRTCLNSYLTRHNSKGVLDLIKHADLIKVGAVYKRLGFLLEADHPTYKEAINYLRGKITKGNSYLDSGLNNQKLSSRWRLWVPEKLDTINTSNKMQENHSLFSNELQCRDLASNSSVTSEVITIMDLEIPKITGEFWTSKQRQASSLHEISYRACFKPQLPNFFIEKFSSPGDIVYDPFGGRGTTSIEAALLRRRVIQNDANPLSKILCHPRLNPPLLGDIEARLEQIDLTPQQDSDIDLSMFYERKTLNEIINLKNYFRSKIEAGTYDYIDGWLQMVATNRLTGHSPGFFSVYTFPPNQAVSPESQIKINQKRNQTPEYKNIKKIIIKKSKQLLGGLSSGEISNLREASKSALFLSCDASATFDIQPETVQLVVTSPPFLDVVQYDSDNWLRCWFNNLDSKTIGKNITMCRKLVDWESKMTEVFKELYRIVRPGGYVAFEVGEIRKAQIRLEEVIAPIGAQTGFTCDSIIINSQVFTKTSNIWGVSNNEAGTNTNRITLFRRN